MCQRHSKQDAWKGPLSGRPGMHSGNHRSSQCFFVALPSQPGHISPDVSMSYFELFMAAEGLTRLDSSVGKAVKLLTVNYLRDQFEWPYRDRFNSGLEDWLWPSCQPLRHEVRDVVDHVSHRSCAWTVHWSHLPQAICPHEGTHGDHC